MLKTVRERLIFDTSQTNRSSHQMSSVEIGVVKNFTKFTGSTCAGAYFLGKKIEKIKKIKT